MNITRFYSLDLLRGMTGMSVAIFHYIFFFYDSKLFEFLSFISVEIFFVLSGFVLSNQLKIIAENKKNLKIFYYRRFLRTIPLYLISLLAFAFIANKFNLEILKYFLFLQKIIPNNFDSEFFFVSWSLAIEEHFYLIFPLIIIFFKNISILKKTIVFIIIFTLLKLLMINVIDGEFLRTATYLRLDAIAIGFLLSFYAEKIFKKKNIFFFLFVFLFISLIIMFYIYQNLNNDYLNYIVFIFIINSQMLSCIILTIFLKCNYLIYNSNVKNIMFNFGNLTYSMYLFHFLLIILINNFFITIGTLSFVSYILMVFAVSYLTYKYFEKPILMLRPKYE